MQAADRKAEHIARIAADALPPLREHVEDIPLLAVLFRLNPFGGLCAPASAPEGANTRKCLILDTSFFPAPGPGVIPQISSHI